MLDAANEVRQFMAGRSRDDLDTDLMLSYAVRYALQVIGEAASQVTRETRAAHPDISWKDIIGMRQWLVHGYEGVRNDIVWNTVNNDLAPLIEQLQAVIASFPLDDSE
jgi:uncharacterized protein with HEPN domain